MHIHLIGIGGSGLSAIAEVLLEKGYVVSGSDRQASMTTNALEEAGVKVTIGHHPENVVGADLVLRSSAVSDENIEVQAARRAGIPVVKRADFLEQLMEGQKGIAIAGTHGKTTTTAMVAWILEAQGLNPSYIIGGRSVNLAGNARAGNGEYFVIEADEYDRMFLGLRPQISVITNIEHDHPDCFPTYQDMLEAFQEYVDRLTAGGRLIASGEDPGAARMLTHARENKGQAYSFGLGRKGFDYWADGLSLSKTGSYSFDFARQESEEVVRVNLQVPGKQNVRNALAAMAVGDLCGIAWAESARALAEFKGTARRFEVVGEAVGVTVIDDYAHHPTEIRATLAAGRDRFPGRRIWAVWQPHTYSRTRTLFDEFSQAFDDADFVLVTEVYAAREQMPTNGFSARRLVEAMPGHAHFSGSLNETYEYLVNNLRSSDVVFVLSAGDANQISARLYQTLLERQNGINRAEGYGS
jgi:UDP-N-acetylmuramate--alanine ligase